MLHGHGDDLHTCGQTIRANFSSNIFATTDLSALQQHLSAHLDVIGHYPEPEPYALESLWADSLGLLPAEICVTNGATEALYLTAPRRHELHPTADLQRICRRLPHAWP